MGILQFFLVLVFVDLPSWTSYVIVNGVQREERNLILRAICYNKDNGCLLCVHRTLVSFTESKKY